VAPNFFCREPEGVNHKKSLPFEKGWACLPKAGMGLPKKKTITENIKPF
jgi:hypothetical protein